MPLATSIWPAVAPDEESMINVTWQPIAKFSLSKEDVQSAWVMAREDLGGATSYLKLKATGKWFPMAGLGGCGPDGLAGRSFPEDRLVLTDCAVGALIGRIGGSSASIKAAAASVDVGETKPFAIGNFALVKLPEKVLGPLYVGFNILLRPINVESLELELIGGC